MLLGLMALVILAPAPPPHDVWLEAESCTDHDFNTIGREAAFGVCYGHAILQLQTTRPAPPGGYHATFRPELPADGWYDIQVAATRTEGAPHNLSPYTFEASGYRPRTIARMPVTKTYGGPRTGEVFGWLDLGRYHLTRGAELTFRCEVRRQNDQAYLCYLDAIALKQVPEPTGPGAWLRGTGDSYQLSGTVELPEVLADARFEVLCDGTFQATVNGREVGRGNGEVQPSSCPLGTAAQPGLNQVTLIVTEAGPGGVLAWFSGVGLDGQRTKVGWTARDWTGGGRPVTVLGPAWMPPYGDMELQPMAKVPVGPTPIPFKTGNLSVQLIKDAAQGKPLPPPTEHPEFDDYHELASIQVVEDYLGWLPAEPERDHWQWDYYLQNAAELERRGMTYAVYPWLHFPPKWALDSELWYPLKDLKHGKSTYAPSIWSPATLRIFDRFYAKLHEVMGDRVKQIFVSMACDYGEVGYPIGMADWVVHAPYKGAGFWCGDDLARADFKQVMLGQYTTLERLNAGWGTTFGSADEITYPEWTSTEGPDFDTLAKLPPGERGQARRRWLDFVQWYGDAMTDFAGRAVAVSRKYYPETPHEIKIGFGSERVCYGADYTAYVARSEDDGYTVRSTHGKLPLYFYRRFSTAAKHYGVGLVTEPPSQVTREEEVERIYKDATSGTTEYFDYPANYLGATDLFARYARYLEGHHSLTEVAFYVPTCDHRLRAGAALPKRLVETCAAASDLFDWDLLDDRLLRDGALSRYRALLLPEGNVFEADELALLRKWVEAGGVLLRGAAGEIETVEGDTSFSQLFPLPPAPSEVLLTQAVPSPAWRLDLGAKGDQPFLTGDWSFAESGHWEWGGESNGIRKRWSGAQSGILLPVDPSKTYELAIDVALHPKRLQARSEVKVNGKLVGKLAPRRTSTFRATLGPEIWQGRNPGELLLDIEAWKPSEIDGTSDTRTLGVAVRRVTLWEAGQPEPTNPPRPVLHREVAADVVREQFVKPLGKGALVALPALSPSELATVLGVILADPAQVGLAQLPALPLPMQADGVWSAILPNRVLCYNSTDEPRRLTIDLDPQVFGRLGAKVTAAKQVELAMPPKSLASIELTEGRVLVP